MISRAFERKLVLFQLHKLIILAITCFNRRTVLVEHLIRKRNGGRTGITRTNERMNEIHFTTVLIINIFPYHFSKRHNIFFSSYIYFMHVCVYEVVFFAPVVLFVCLFFSHISTEMCALFYAVQVQLRIPSIIIFGLAFYFYFFII